jgi:hypothetical protein
MDSGRRAGSCIIKVTRVDPARPEIHFPRSRRRPADLRARPSLSARFEIDIRVGVDGANDLGVYDALGRRVATLDLGSGRPLDTDPLWRTVVWNGMLSAGRPGPPGVYFIRLATEGEARAVKVILQR